MIRPWVFPILRLTGLPALVRATVQKRKITILVFHDLAPAAADRAFATLGRAYNVIPLARAVEAIERKDPAGLPPRSLVITFDDGLRSHYALLPVIRKHRLPVTIFICAGLVGTNRHFWFLHDSPARRDPRWRKLSHTERLNLLRDEGFGFETEYETRQALSRAEIEAMRPDVDLQSHSMYHENLETCGPEALEAAIAGSKAKLEGDLSLSVFAFAYPSGDHTPSHAAMVRAAGYRCAATVDPGLNSVRSDPFLLKRIEALGPDASGNRNELIVRSSGILNLPKELYRAVRRPIRRLRDRS